MEPTQKLRIANQGVNKEGVTRTPKNHFNLNFLTLTLRRPLLLAFTFLITTIPTSFSVVPVVYGKPNCNVADPPPICDPKPSPSPSPSPLPSPSPSPAPPPPSTTARSYVEVKASLSCFKTNDDTFNGTRDEIFVLVNGQYASFQMPGPDAVWGGVEAGNGRAKDVFRLRLLGGNTLDVGQKTTYLLTVVERDNSNLEGWFRFSAQIAAELSKNDDTGIVTITALALSLFTDIFSWFNKNDLIGSVAIEVYNDNGVIRYEARSVKDAQQLSHYRADYFKHALSGADSKYFLELEAQSQLVP